MMSLATRSQVRKRLKMIDTEWEKGESSGNQSQNSDLDILSFRRSKRSRKSGLLSSPDTSFVTHSTDPDCSTPYRSIDSLTETSENDFENMTARTKVASRRSKRRSKRVNCMIKNVIGKELSPIAPEKPVLSQKNIKNFKLSDDHNVIKSTDMSFVTGQISEEIFISDSESKCDEENITLTFEKKSEKLKEAIYEGKKTCNSKNTKTKKSCSTKLKNSKSVKTEIKMPRSNSTKKFTNLLKGEKIMPKGDLILDTESDSENSSITALTTIQTSRKKNTSSVVGGSLETLMQHKIQPTQNSQTEKQSRCVRSLKLTFSSYETHHLEKESPTKIDCVLPSSLNQRNEIHFKNSDCLPPAKIAISTDAEVALSTDEEVTPSTEENIVRAETPETNIEKVIEKNIEAIGGNETNQNTQNIFPPEPSIPQNTEIVVTEPDQSKKEQLPKIKLNICSNKNPIFSDSTNVESEGGQLKKKEKKFQEKIIPSKSLPLPQIKVPRIKSYYIFVMVHDSQMTIIHNKITCNNMVISSVVEGFVDEILTSYISLSVKKKKKAPPKKMTPPPSAPPPTQNVIYFQYDEKKRKLALTKKKSSERRSRSRTGVRSKSITKKEEMYMKRDSLLPAATQTLKPKISKEDICETDVVDNFNVCNILPSTDLFDFDFLLKQGELDQGLIGFEGP